MYFYLHLAFIPGSQYCVDIKIVEFCTNKNLSRCINNIYIHLSLSPTARGTVKSLSPAGGGVEPVTEEPCTLKSSKKDGQICPPETDMNWWRKTLVRWSRGNTAAAAFAHVQQGTWVFVSIVSIRCPLSHCNTHTGSDCKLSDLITNMQWFMHWLEVFCLRFCRWWCTWCQCLLSVHATGLGDGWLLSSCTSAAVLSTVMSSDEWL